MNRVLIAALILALLPVAAACGGPENVLVVQNSSSPTSMNIAAYYMNQRGVPAGNLVTVNVPDSSLAGNEIITLANYTSLIDQPVRNHLQNNGLTNTIRYIVLTKGVPHRLSSDSLGGTSGARSVDSVLAGIDLVNEISVAFYNEDNVYLGTVSMNRYWLSRGPFSHAQYGGYLVTRLDGYTMADAKALVDRATAPQSAPHYVLIDIDADRGIGNPSVQPKSLLLPDDTLDPNYELEYLDYNADMLRAWQIISNRPHLSVQLEATSTFTGSQNPLSGYVSWGSNDLHYSVATYTSLTFAPGGIAETAVSTSGRTLLPAVGGQSLIAQLISQGAAGGKGYVTEPYLDAVASPSVLLDRYTAGYNLAESYYAASRFVKWKDIVLGDPLASLRGATAATVAAAKALPDGSLITLTDQVVSADTDDFSDRFYVQDVDGASGIQVYTGQAYPDIDRGDTVSVRGILETRNGERVLVAARVTEGLQSMSQLRQAPLFFEGHSKPATPRTHHYTPRSLEPAR